MKTTQLRTALAIAAALAVISLGNQLQAQSGDWGPGGQGFGPGPGMFVDENGDGINDLAPDADGDGIPNGEDEDYVRPANGTGYGPGGESAGGFGQGNEWSGNGPHNGAGNFGTRPGDGTGYGTGNCTGENLQNSQHQGNGPTR